jgi:hypothetical protein
MMKVGDLVRVTAAAGSGFFSRQGDRHRPVHGQLGVIIEIELDSMYRERRVLLTDGTKEWFEIKELEVVNESR